jgi:hypothetical protein
MIRIERAFDSQKIHAYIEKQVEARKSDIIDYLKNKAIEATETARAKTLSSNPYNNITFNLVSSVGFCIVQSGAVKFMYFPLLRTGSEGQKKGKATSERAAKELSGTDDITIVLVAGENYASFVQAKGKDVIKLASIKFETLLQTEWGGNR